MLMSAPVQDDHGRQCKRHGRLSLSRPHPRDEDFARAAERALPPCREARFRNPQAFFLTPASSLPAYLVQPEMPSIYAIRNKLQSGKLNETNILRLEI